MNNIEQYGGNLGVRTRKGGLREPGSRERSRGGGANRCRARGEVKCRTVPEGSRAHPSSLDPKVADIIHPRGRLMRLRRKGIRAPNSSKSRRIFFEYSSKFYRRVELFRKNLKNLFVRSYDNFVNYFIRRYYIAFLIFL